MKQWTRTGLFVLAILATATTSALAGIGLQAGMSVDPDDFLIGLRFRSHPLGESFYLVPNVDAGFGDITMIAGNLDAHYHFKTSSKLQPYLGGGASLVWYDFDGGSNTEFGGSVLGGIMLSPKLGLEAKLGLGDVPDWKFLLIFQVK